MKLRKDSVQGDQVGFVLATDPDIGQTCCYSILEILTMHFK
ncbi:MAG: hypothetical protein R2764_25545 [Bacteroidales bacterium]